jgi:peptidoglycan/xylan/chitin deacetylase (PgdA/CDA1 family)
MASLYLTFDVEDFISQNSIAALHQILELLRKHDIVGLFFITGSCAEKLANYPKTIRLLNDQQIGYHSSGHSIHPAIFEFTDVESFEAAYQMSIVRECSHINPLTGNMDGPGGIYALKRLFPSKKIVSFRAPGYCWSPPHTEALKTLGIAFDFSTRILPYPFNYDNLTLYPFPFLCYGWNGGVIDHFRLQKRVLSHDVSVLTIHPSTMVNQVDWDSIYYHRQKGLSINPDHLIIPLAKSTTEVISVFRKFDLLLRHLKTLQKTHLLLVTPELKKADKNLYPSPMDALKSYKLSISWAEGFGYKSKFLYKHFVRFFKAET